MSHSHSMHQFADGANAQIPGLRSHDCELIIVQEPLNGKVSVGKEKDRKPLDPQPILQLKINPLSDPHQNYLQSPYFFVTCGLHGHPGTALAGTVVSSLHRLKDTTNKDGAYFIFMDLSVRLEGNFQLRFDLYEMQGQFCVHVATTLSRNFTVYSQKNFPGMSESTPLTRTFAEQGVRLRVRKEPRSLLKPKGPASDDYTPRQYQKGRAPQTELPSPISPDIARLAQVDQLDSQGYQVHSSQTQPLRQISRSYSHHSQQSQESSAPYDEPSAKRPRTGSEHSQPQSFGHQTVPIENPQYQSGVMYTDSQDFTPLSQQQPYGFPYAQSPQETARDQYFPQRIPMRSASYSGASGHMSPQNFPPQPQALRAHPQTPTYYTPSPPMPPPQRSQTDYSSTGYASRSFIPQEMIVPHMEHDWARMGAQPLFQHSAGISNANERQGYATAYQNPNVSAGSAGGLPVSTSSGTSLI